MKPRSFYIKTFGCQMNERDSEIMAQSLGECGYVAGNSMEEADLVILNTCSIRAKAEQKVMSLLGYLRKAKQNNPGLKICVAGCVAQQEGQKLIDRMGHVDLVAGTQNIYNIGKLVSRCDHEGSIVATELRGNYAIPKLLPVAGKGRDFNVLEGGSPEPETAFSKFVTIMQGCNNYCTYCVVPYTRGREISRNVNDILDESRILVKKGVKEITLLGQNVNSYGRTNRVIDGGLPYGFANLLHDVAKIDGLQRLRFTTSNPKDLTDQLMASFRDIDILCPQFHLPVQAGSNAVLQRMNRKYTREQYLRLVDKLHHYCQSIALTTDIIVGFPGETDADFEATMDLLEQVRFHGSFSFKYSDRPGTRASEFTGKVPEEVKAGRLTRFQARQDEISLARNQEYVGKELQVLVEHVETDSGRGRTVTNHIVHLHDCEVSTLKAGDEARVRIVHAGQHSLRGELC